MTFLNYVQEQIKTAVDAIKAVTDLLPNGGALSDLAQDSTVAKEATIGTPTDTDIATDIANVQTAVDGLSGSPIARKTVTFSNTTGTVNLFTVSNWVKIKLSARVKTSCTSVGGCNIKLGLVGATEAFIADTDLTALAAGEIWNDTTPNTTYERYYNAVFEYEVGDGADIIATLSAQADSGVIEFTVEYTAMSSDGAVVAA